MAGFVLPNFNKTVGIYRPGSNLFLFADVTSLAQLAPGRVTSSGAPEGLDVEVGVGGMWLRLPVGTDIRDDHAPAGEDLVMFPDKSYRTYRVAWVDEIGGGFPNEHRFAVIQKIGFWPIPFPPIGGPFVSIPPGPPALMYKLTSGGIPSNLITTTFSVPAAGTVWQATAWYNQAVNATVNGSNVPVGGIVHTNLVFPTTQRMAIWRVPVVAGPNTIHTNFIGMTACPMQAIGLYEPFTTGLQDATSFSGGMLMAPSCAAVPNPLGTRILMELAILGDVMPPVGADMALPFIQSASITDTVGLQPWQLMVGFYIPPSGQANATWIPALGAWNSWQAMLIECA